MQRSLALTVACIDASLSFEIARKMLENEKKTGQTGTCRTRHPFLCNRCSKQLHEITRDKTTFNIWYVLNGLWFLYLNILQLTQGVDCTRERFAESTRTQGRRL